MKQLLLLTLLLTGCKLDQPPVPAADVMMRVEIEGVDLRSRTPMLRVTGWSLAQEGAIARGTWNVRLQADTAISHYLTHAAAKPEALQVGSRCDIYAFPQETPPYRFVATTIVLDN